jgi:hypothetical protein
LSSRDQHNQPHRFRESCRFLLHHSPSVTAFFRMKHDL